MKLTITLIDERTTYDNYYQTATTKPKVEQYTRVEVADFTGNKSVIAAALRGIADDIDPLMTLSEKALIGELQ